jgi:multiple sugar transport system substrate-binding protein
VDLDNERNLEAFTLLSQVAKSGYTHPASPGYSMDDALSAFAQGKAAMILWNPGMSTRLPNLAEKVGVLKPLAGPHGDHGTIYWVNNIMLYQQSKHPAETKEFLEWWSEHELDLWTKGHVSQLPVRASFANDSYFQSNAEIKSILDNYVPIGETTATHASSIFPELNEVEGEGVMQTLVQNLLQGKDVKESVKTAAARIKSIMGQ